MKGVPFVWGSRGKGGGEAPLNPPSFTIEMVALTSWEGGKAKDGRTGAVEKRFNTIDIIWD